MKGRKPGKTGRHRRLWVWLVRVCVPALFCIPALLLLVRQYKDYQYRNYQGRVYRRQISEEVGVLDVREKKLQEELDVLRKEFASKIMPSYAVVPILTDLDEGAFPKAAELLENYQIKGMIGLSPRKLPGESGMISQSVFRNLVRGGWQTCICWNGEGSFSVFLDSMQERLRQKDIALPETVLFAEGCYSEEYDSAAEEAGIRNILYYSDKSVTNLIRSWSGNRLNKVVCCDWEEEGEESRVDTYIAKAGDEGGIFGIVFSFEDDPDELLDGISDFLMLLWRLQENGEKCSATTLAAAFRMKAQESDEDMLSEREIEIFMNSIQELESELSDLASEREKLLGLNE